MSRSLKKGPWIDPSLQRKVDKVIESGNRRPIRTWARASTILPEYVGMTFMVHNGKDFLKVYVTEDMVGHRLGDGIGERATVADAGRATVVHDVEAELRRRACKHASELAAAEDADHRSGRKRGHSSGVSVTLSVWAWR